MSSLTDLFYGMQLKIFISINQILDMVHVKEVQKYFKKCLPTLGHTYHFIQWVNVSYRLIYWLLHCAACGILTALTREGSDLSVRVLTTGSSRGSSLHFLCIHPDIRMSTKCHTADLRNMFRIPKLVYGTWIFFWFISFIQL